ncbi:Phosphoesterase DHH family protein [Mycoplasmopsis bovigenitalium 51080]|uniref:Phosphoesterase DHH family protein n=1 Tax=Mycoplasmopsis bovigenitalium 51080 TaxID=1188235 RepID=N9TU48_9BACT|nr:DHHA1 domain-containing protein [Mycoplasmopsis bovigenitalium]ENY69620.1 Phosphoesterase DHH family protein [Mycoplasmopsis bovigenitalium 51080]
MKQKFKQFWQYILENEYITLLTHKNPDGDTIGSSIALREIILLNSKKTKQVEISGGDCPRNLEFLFPNKLDLVDKDFFDKSLKIVVDTCSKKRVFDQRVEPINSLKFDHHPEEDQFMFEIGGDHWPATGQLLAEMVIELNLKVNQLALQAMTVAILTDTNNFTERNISSKTFDIMSWIMSKGVDYKKAINSIKLNNEEKQIIHNTISTIKTEGIVSYIISEKIISNDIVRPLVNQFLNISNSEVNLAVLKDKKGLYRCSIRSTSSFDVNEIAKIFGGGGHHNSSGFILNSIEEVKNVLEIINAKK